MFFRLAAVFVRASTDGFQEDRYSYPERQRRLAAKKARPWRRFAAWYWSIGRPAKLLVSVWIVALTAFFLLLGGLIGLIIRIKITGL